jgi:hypothetical protein
LGYVVDKVNAELFGLFPKEKGVTI